MLLAVIGMVAAMATSSYAHIGETYQELRKRYGKPVARDADHMTFAYRGIIINAGFTNGYCDVLMYTNKDGSDFTADQVSYLLRNNMWKGYVWQNNVFRGEGAVWSWITNVDGTSYYALLFRNPHAQGRMSLLIGDHYQMAGRGYLFNPTPAQNPGGFEGDASDSQGNVTYY